MSNYNSTLQSNSIDLQAILNTINELPEANNGVELPELTTPATSEELFANKELIDGDGNVVTGTFSIDSELTVQDDLIAKIQSALEGKASASEPVLQSKTVTPTTSIQNVTADSGYDGLFKVTVNAMPTASQATPSISVNSNGLITASATQSAGYVSAGTKSATKQLATKAAATYTPTTSNQTIAAGTYCSGVQTIKGDVNLKAENIAEGVNIFGITGTHSGGSSGSGGSVETCAVTLINTNMDDDYYVCGVWVDGAYISSYDTDIFCDDSKTKQAVKNSYITFNSSILKSTSGSCNQIGIVGTAVLLKVTGDCTITLE